MAVTTRGLFASFRVLRPTASLFRGRLRGTLALYSNEKPDGQDSDKINQDGSVYSPDRFAWFMSRARVLPCFNIELMLLFRFPEGYNGAGLIPFDANVSEILMAPINEQEVEIKPDGLIYLPEIKYRRILNKAFGPGGWALIPRGDSLQFQSEKDNSQLIVREYALFCFGRYVSQTAGEHTFYSAGNMVYGKAMEAAKSNALMRCCKDLGVSSELWDPQFIIKWKEKYAVVTWCENVKNKEKKKMWRRKDRKSTDAFFYPWKEVNT
ncbi:hypothetical protein QZH41_017816 [Actinostola sp. cb2023]|nr:hypothetical protein QZH41_017816 [Actinostola sp. cb2023]